MTFDFTDSTESNSSSTDSDFTFTSTTNASQGNKGFDWDDDESIVTFYDEGVLRVELCDELIQHARHLASQRNNSNGGTAERRDKESSDFSIHFRGLLAEAALAAAYDEATLDEEIYEGHGDGGVDSAMTLDGTHRTIDIKAAKRRPPWIKVEKGAIDSKNDDGCCDAYMAAYVEPDEGLVDFYGWLPAEKVVAERNLRETRRRDSDHKNYTVEDGFRGMPKLGGGGALLP